MPGDTTQSTSEDTDELGGVPDALFADIDEADAGDAVPWEDSDDDGDENELDAVIGDYWEMVDGVLIEEEWGVTPAKSVQLGKKDQSMVNHIRNAVFFLHRLAKQVRETELPDISASKLRNVIALTVIHDYHKLRDEDETPGERFDISEEEIEAVV